MNKLSQATNNWFDGFKPESTSPPKEKPKPKPKPSGLKIQNVKTKDLNFNFINETNYKFTLRICGMEIEGKKQKPFKLEHDLEQNAEENEYWRKLKLKDEIFIQSIHGIIELEDKCKMEIYSTEAKKITFFQMSELVHLNVHIYWSASTKKPHVGLPIPKLEFDFIGTI